MPLTTATLHAFLPEFTTTDADKLAKQNAAILVTTALTNGYVGLAESIRDIALSLAVASSLTEQNYFSNSATGSTSAQASNQLVKRYKSYQDEIEYHTPTAQNTSSESQNTYQLQLNQLLANNSFPVAVNGSCGCDGGRFAPFPTNRHFF